MSRDPVLIGRTQELDHLRQALAATLAGRGTLVGLVGDAGVGKTHLATVLAREAEGVGCVVAWGRCRESDGAPAFWPWTQALATIDRAYAGAGVSEVLSRAHGTADLLASLATSRVTLFAQVGGALLDLARTRPLVVVLDDLHRADLPSLRLLGWLAHDAGSAPLLVVATWRDGEVRRDPEHESVLADVARAGRILLVGGLGAVEVGKLLRTRLGDDLDPLLPRAVAELTGGNPFFVLEVASMLEGSPRRGVEDLARLPSSAGVRGMVRQRFDSLPAPTVETLQAAAVLGREFDVTVLAAMVGCSVDDAVARLAPAERLGLVLPDPAVLRRHVFAHALVRDTIYDLLPSTDLAPRHRRAADAVVATAGASLDAVLTTVSHHHFEAARGGDARDAAAWSARAARQALSRLAFEDAVVCFERALQALDCIPDADPAERTDVTMGLAEALAGSGRHDRAVEVAADAVRSAAALDAEVFARSALRQAELRREFGLLDVVANAALEEGLRRLPPTDGALRAHVMGRLAAGLHLQPGAEARRHTLADEALAMAERLGDVSARILVATYRMVALFGPDTLDERLATVEELVALAEASGDRARALPALVYGVHDLLELGDRRGFERRITACDRLASELRMPLGRWMVASFRTMVALMEGRWLDAEGLATEALTIGQQAQMRSAILHYGQQLVSLRGEAGRIAEVIPLIEMAAVEASTVPAWHCTLADLYWVVGRRDDAAREFEALAASGFAEIPRDTSWLVAVSLIAGVCADLGDQPRAKLLYAMLTPYRDLIAAARPAIVGLGPVSTMLGRLAGVLGEWDAANLHFERAVIIAERMGARPWAARARVHWAEMLAHVGGAAERERGAAILEAGRAIATPLRMQELLGRVPAIAARLAPTPDAQMPALALERRHAVGEDASPSGKQPRRAAVIALAPRPAGARATPAPVEERSRMFRRDGELWSVGWSDRPLLVRHTVGLVYVAHLLARPSEEVHVGDLVRLTSGGRTSPTSPAAEGLAVTADLGDSGPMLDPIAKAQYRRRIAELEHELDEAEEFRDLGRVERMRGELEFVRHELARSVGLGGQDRLASAATERARVAVTKAIRYSLRKISAQDAAFAKDLDLVIRTGTYCAYVRLSGDSTTWLL